MASVVWDLYRSDSRPGSPLNSPKLSIGVGRAASQTDIDRMKSMAPCKQIHPDTELVTVEATEEQSIYLREIIFNYNSKMLTYDQHVQRERLLASTEHARNCIKTWVLVPKDDQDGLNIKCSARVYERDAVVALPDGQCFEIKAVSAGACATPLHHRKSGYAKQLISDVMSKYKFSDQKFAFCQWFSHADKVFQHLNPTTSLSYKCRMTDSARLQSENCDVEVRYFSSKELRFLCKQENDRIRKETAATAKKIGKPVAATLMNAGWLSYRCLEGQLLLSLCDSAPQLSPEDLEICGARIGDFNSADLAFILWRPSLSTLSLADNHLSITMAKFSTSHQASLLLNAAVKVSQKWGMNKLPQWRASPNQVPIYREINVLCKEAQMNDQVLSLLVKIDEVSDNTTKNSSRGQLLDHELYSVELHAA